MNKDVWEQVKEDNKKINELVKKYILWNGLDWNAIIKKIEPYVIRPKQFQFFDYCLVREDAPEEIRLLHKFMTKMADRENWACFEDEDYIRNPDDEDTVFKDGKFLGFKYSDTYKPELKEQGEIYTILMNDPRKIFA